jgi:quercetin dioxygenase-like cupin family protein
MNALIRRTIGTLLFLAGAAGVTSEAAWAQATSRDCAAQGPASDRPGPACLLKREVVGDLDGAAVYWRLYTYPTVQAAELDKPAHGTVVEAFGKVWLFTVGPLTGRLPHGDHQADIGPLATEPGRTYAAEYLKSVFSPGMTAPVHVHSGPEAFYAIGGDTCLETPDGVQVARGPGNSLTVRAGPPMLLMAVGTEPRRGFALILHDTSLPPTTLVNDWRPKGLCTVH